VDVISPQSTVIDTISLLPDEFPYSIVDNPVNHDLYTVVLRSKPQQRRGGRRHRTFLVVSSNPRGHDAMSWPPELNEGEQACFAVYRFSSLWPAAC
jgi:hypothetical protein